MKTFSHLLFFVPPKHQYTSHINHQLPSYFSPNDLECTRLCPPFHRDLYDFYRDNFSPNKRLVPSLPQDDDSDDAIYILKNRSGQHKDIIVAALRLTRSKSDRQYTFLRSLCCAKEYRRKGFGMHLIQSSLSSFGFDNSSCYCFASSELNGFYKKAGFVQLTPRNDVTDVSRVPNWLLHSYTMMANKWIQKGKSLDLFVQQTAKKSPVKIILLQHREEALKSTSSGWLAEDTLYNQSIGDIQSLTVPLEPRLCIQCWEWSGRNDTATIETQIKQLASNSSVYLLWTGQNIDTANDDANSEASYLILDGTWKQAQSMFRKIPSLWNLPRISLTDPAPSKYILRQDYTGWRERFSTNGNEGGGLLCTAEVMASLLDRRGDGIGADEIRNRLDVFQQNYPIIVSRRKK